MQGWLFGGGWTLIGEQAVYAASIYQGTNIGFRMPPTSPKGPASTTTPHAHPKMSNIRHRNRSWETIQE